MKASSLQSLQSEIIYFTREKTFRKKILKNKWKLIKMYNKNKHRNNSKMGNPNKTFTFYTQSYGPILINLFIL